MIFSSRLRQDGSGQVPPSVPSTRSRKRRTRDDNCDEAGSREPKRRLSEPDGPREDEGSRFQCPFFLRYPDRTDLRLACRRGLGFASISRVLEHLHRAHAQLRCKRCGEKFEEPRELEQHGLADITCSRKVSPLWESAVISEDRLRALSSTLRRCRGSSHEKWIKLWQFLFGDEAVAPSPHTRPETIELARKLTAALSTSLPDQILQGGLGLYSSNTVNGHSLQPLIAAWVDKAVQACLGPVGLHAQSPAISSDAESSQVSDDPAGPCDDSPVEGPLSPAPIGPAAPRDGLATVAVDDNPLPGTQFLNVNGTLLPVAELSAHTHLHTVPIYGRLYIDVLPPVLDPPPLFQPAPSLTDGSGCTSILDDLHYSALGVSSFPEPQFYDAAGGLFVDQQAISKGDSTICEENNREVGFESIYYAERYG